MQEDTSTNDEDGVTISLKGDSISCSSEAVSFSDGKVVISAAGTYILTGELNGSVYIEAGKEDVIHLILDGASISSAEASPIYEEKCDKLIVTLKDGSKNSFNS